MIDSLPPRPGRSTDDAARAAADTEAQLDLEGRYEPGLQRAADAYAEASASCTQAGDTETARFYLDAFALLLTEASRVSLLGPVLPEEYFRRAERSALSRATMNPASMTDGEIECQLEDLKHRGSRERNDALAAELAARAAQGQRDQRS